MLYVLYRNEVEMLKLNVASHCYVFVADEWFVFTYVTTLQKHFDFNKNLLLDTYAFVISNDSNFMYIITL